MIFKCNKVVRMRVQGSKMSEKMNATDYTSNLRFVTPPKKNHRFLPIIILIITNSMQLLYLK